MQVSTYDAGVFNWVDLQTTDLDAAKAFYSQMFGWKVEDAPLPHGGVYSMASLNGKSICGLTTLPPGKEIPPHWNNYVSVDDLEPVCARVPALGGSVVIPPFDVPDAGRMAVLADRDGAALSLWQPGAHCGSEIVNEPNSFCWNELYAKSLDGAGEFYSGLFGWKLEAHDAGGFPMLMIEQLGRQIGSMIEIQSEWGPVPPNWAIYFAVENCDGWIKKSIELGGALFHEPKDIPDVGRFAGMTDPQGAHMMIIQLTGQAANA